MAAASQLYQKLDVGFADEGATQCERAHNGNIRQAQRAAARTVIHNGRVRVGRPIAPVLMLNSGSDAYNAVGIPSNEYNTVDFPSDEHNAVGIPSQRREGGAVRCARGGAAGVAEQQQQQRQKGGSYHVQVIILPPLSLRVMVVCRVPAVSGALAVGTSSGIRT